MARIVVASQLPERLNSMLASYAPQIEFRLVPPGRIDFLADDITILLAAPFVAAGEPTPEAVPAGWPFRIRWVHVLSAGLDYYPDWLFAGPIVTSPGGASATSVAEFAIAACMASAKRLPEVWIEQPGRWDRSFALGSVAGATLGVVGFGAIGRAVAGLALALGMRVQAVRRSARPFDLPGVARSPDLPALFRASDHVVLAAPGQEESRHMIGRDLLAQAKPGLHLVNVARGMLIDDAALLGALDAGRLSRATLDVTFPEPLPAGHPFYSHPRVKLSPHISFNTARTQEHIGAQFATNLARFERGEPLVDRVLARALR